MLDDFGHMQSGNDEKKNIISNKLLGRLAADIVMGQPSKHCKFHGICRISPSFNLEANDFINSKSYIKNSLKAVLEVDKDKKLKIKFDRSTITSFIEKEHLSGDVFTVSESIVVPDFVSSFFGISFEIKKGVYTIEKGEDFYQIKI